MQNRFRNLIFAILFVVFTFPLSIQAFKAGKTDPTKDQLLQAFHEISSNQLFTYVLELCSEQYGGRLSGTAGYDMSAAWIADRLAEWGIAPAGDNGTYFQSFHNPYTLVHPGGRLSIHVPYGRSATITKTYRYQKDFLPGSTSDSGEITAEVVYVGYGISAPELGYDDYHGLDVRGKIVLMEREVPVSPAKDPDKFKKWRPYSFHQYKVKNAKAHGASAMLYNYHIANPNCLFLKNFLLTYIGPTVLADIFKGTGKSHEKVLKKIRQTLRPQSFTTAKTITIKNVTEHRADGKTANVLGVIPGRDGEVKGAIIIGAHLDHVGRNHLLMPGANDNASGVAVVLGVAKAFASLGVKPAHSIVFVFFAAEEQGVKGSEHYLKSPYIPNSRIKAFLNFDGVGRGDTINVLAAKNFPLLWQYVNQANHKYVFRTMAPSFFHNLARPRLDAAHFMWAGIPTLSFSCSGGAPLPESIYHKTTDTPDLLTPEIMEDLARIIFLSVAEMDSGSSRTH